MNRSLDRGRRPHARIAVRVALGLLAIPLATLTGVLQREQALTAGAAGSGGGVFVTGHDPDYHAAHGANSIGSQHIIQRGIAYATGNKASPKILLAADWVSTPPLNGDSRDGLRAAGYTTFDFADFGSGFPGTYDLNKVRFSDWDVLVVASDNAGSLQQPELDALNRRVHDIADFVARGGGLVVFGEDLLVNRFGFLPCLTSDLPVAETESGFTVTPTGLAMGLTDDDVNGNVSTNIFTSYTPFVPVDLNPSKAVESVAALYPCPKTARVPLPPHPPPPANVQPQPEHVHPPTHHPITAVVPGPAPAPAPAVQVQPAPVAHPAPQALAVQQPVVQAQGQAAAALAPQEQPEVQLALQTATGQEPGIGDGWQMTGLQAGEPPWYAPARALGGGLALTLLMILGIRAVGAVEASPEPAWRRRR